MDDLTDIPAAMHWNASIDKWQFVYAHGCTIYFGETFVEHPSCAEFAELKRRAIIELDL